MMRMRTLLTLLLSLTTCIAFAPLYSNVRSRIHSSSPLYSVVEKDYRITLSENDDTHDINRKLDAIATRCTDPSQPVILLASQGEDLFHAAGDKVDTVSFNTLLKIWAKTCSTLSDFRHSLTEPNAGGKVPSVPVYTARDAVEHATSLLVEMERAHEQDPNTSIVPDATSYNVVIAAWAKSRVDDAPQACERLLKRMIQHETIEPDTLSYNGVLDAWAQARTKEGMDRMLKIWRHMESLYENDPNGLVKPTMRTVNSIVSAHAKQCINLKGTEALESARAAHDLLKEMTARYEQTQDPDHQPDVMTYTSVMDAYGRCGSVEATMLAEDVFRDLHALYNATGNVRLMPNFRTYTSLITAWSKTRSDKSPHRAEELLKEMQESHTRRLNEDRPMEPGEDTTKPNTRTYTGVIQAWARSRDPTKPQRVLKILKLMKEKAKNGDRSVKPNIITYNAAIDACARCQGDSKQLTEALKIAFAILKTIELEPDIQANHVTYATALRATAFLLPAGPERNKVATALFHKARAAGMVDVNMVKNLRKAVDNKVMFELLEDFKDSKGLINYSNIPAAWSKNVRY